MTGGQLQDVTNENYFTKRFTLGKQAYRQDKDSYKRHGVYNHLYFNGFRLLRVLARSKLDGEKLEVYPASQGDMVIYRFGALFQVPL